jgi:hypothetical protein
VLQPTAPRLVQELVQVLQVLLLPDLLPLRVLVLAPGLKRQPLLLDLVMRPLWPAQLASLLLALLVPLVFWAWLLRFNGGILFYTFPERGVVGGRTVFTEEIEVKFLCTLLLLWI